MAKGGVFSSEITSMKRGSSSCVDTLPDSISTISRVVVAANRAATVQPDVPPPITTTGRRMGSPL